MSIRDDLKAYVDGELTPSREAEVRQAIDADPSLQAEVIELRQLSRSVRSYAVSPPSVGLESTLLALRRGDVSKQAANRTRLMVGLGLAASIALATVIVPRLERQNDEAAGGTREAPLMAKSEDAAAVRPVEKQALSQESSASTNGSNNLNGSGGAPAASMPADSQVPPRSEAFRYATGRGSAAAPMPARAKTEPATVALKLEVAELDAAATKVERLVRKAAGEVRLDLSAGLKLEEQPGGNVMMVRLPKQRVADLLKRLPEVGRVSFDRSVVLGAVKPESLSPEFRDSKVVGGNGVNPTSEAKQSRPHDSDGYSVKSDKKAKASWVTVEIRLVKKAKPRPRPVRVGWIEESWTGATDSLGRFAEAAGRAGVYAVVFTPVWAPIFGLALWVIRRRA